MMKRLILLCGLLAGCAADTGAIIEVTGVVAPSSTCVFVATGPDTASSGHYDPRGYGGNVPLGYRLGLRLFNNGIQPAADPATVEGNRNVRLNANDLSITGFDTCFDVASKHSGFGSDLLDCGTLPPAQRAFVGSATGVPAQATGMALVDVLLPEHLRALYGNDFDPTLIPGLEPTIAVGTVRFTPPAESAASPGRSTAWGGFPQDPFNTSRVLVSLRAVGRTVSGTKVTSNYFTFPIDVTVGLLSSFCQPEPAATCLTANAYQGAFVDFGASCLPASGGRIACRTVACP